MTTNADAKQSFFVFIKDTNTGCVKRLAIPSDVQIGLTGQPAELQLLGRLSLASKIYNGSAAAINTSNNDTIINVSIDPSGALAHGTHIPMYLPSSPRDGQIHFVKDYTGTAGWYPIDVYPPAGSLIDNLATGSITIPYSTFSAYWMAGNWHSLIPVATVVSTSSGGGGGGGGGAGSNSHYVLSQADGTLPFSTLLVGKNGVGVNVSTVSLAITGQNLGIATGSHGEIIVSGSAQLITNLSGLGGTSVAINTSLYTVSSSVGADIFGSYLLAAPNANDTASRTVKAGANISITDGGGGGTFTIAQTTAREDIPILAGLQSVNQTVFQDIAAFEFNPDGSNSMRPSGSVSFQAFFLPLVEAFPSGSGIEVRLYNLTANSYVQNSLLSSSSDIMTHLSTVNLSSSFAGGTNIYTMQMRLQSSQFGDSQKATCKGARLRITWL